jgi:hypothetical protein
LNPIFAIVNKNIPKAEVWFGNPAKKYEKQ